MCSVKGHHNLAEYTQPNDTARTVVLLMKSTEGPQLFTDDIDAPLRVMKTAHITKPRRGATLKRLLNCSKLSTRHEGSRLR